MESCLRSEVGCSMCIELVGITLSVVEPLVHCS